ncbi:MAG: topoisomerase DNA-binding C4 zinc finger domain-containing protein [Rhodospirillales bacterium]|nr:topoisomerase DNA-binding C4 zinc finger domain-containing protein [Rhodospirillales bacterium]
MEADLDRVAAGGTAWSRSGDPSRGRSGRPELRSADIRDALESALERYLFVSAGEAADRVCPACADSQLMLKIGRFGLVVACAEFPECRYSRPLSADPAEREEARRPVVLDADAETGLLLTLRSGRYGRYIQCGEDESDVRALASLAGSVGSAVAIPPMPLPPPPPQPAISSNVQPRTAILLISLPLAGRKRGDDANRMALRRRRHRNACARWARPAGRRTHRRSAGSLLSIPGH